LKQEQESNDWIDATSGKNGPLDITKLAPMNPALDLYRASTAANDGDYGGQGLLSMSGEGSAAQPGLAMLIKQNRADRQKQVAGGALADAFRQTDARERGAIGSLLSLQQGRNMGLASLTGGMTDAARSRWAGYTPRPGFFNQFGSSFAQSLGQTLGSFGRNSQGGWSVGQGFARGGNLSNALRHPGDTATVGEEGTEIARRKTDGTIEIIPLSRPGPPPPSSVMGVGDLYALSDTLSGRTGGSAVRPRTVTPSPLPSPVAHLLEAARATGSPVVDSPSPTLAAPPAADPTQPLIARTPSEFQSQSVPMLRPPKAQNMPAPGEEEANDALVRSRIESAGGFAEMGDVHTRPRIADPLGFAEHRVEEDALLGRPADRNGRLVSTLKGLGRGFLEGGVLGSLVGAGTHALDPSLDESDDQRRMVGRDVAVADTLTHRRAASLGLQGAAADVENKREASPLKWAALNAQQLQRDRSNVLAQVRARKGTRFDASDPLLAQAESLGMHFDPDSLNDASSNYANVELIDPQNPTTTQKGRLNKVTGEVEFYGAGRYLQPVDSKTGMTPYQTGSLSLGGARFGETTRHNRVTETQGGERIGIARENLGIARGRLTLAQAAQDSRFGEQDRKEYADAAKMLAEAEQASNEADAYVANAMYKDKDTGQMVRSRKYDVKAAELQAKAEALRERLYSVHGDLWRKDDGQLHMTSAEWRQNHPNVPVSIASRYKIIIDDDPSMNPSTPQGRNLPPAPAPRRVAAPRGASSASPAPSSGKTHVTRADARSLYPQLKNASDADVDAAIRAGGFEPIP
jgi:hypothetical protein